MSGLNASLGYFTAVLLLAAAVRALLKRWPRLGLAAELASSFALVACRLEVQTIVEVGEWAVGLGSDVTLTVLFGVLLAHGAICGGASGNPAVSAQRFLRREAGALHTALAVAAQFLGAHLALLAAAFYWSLELTEMHMLKMLMWSECSSSLAVAPLQGFVAEACCSLGFHLALLNLQRRSALVRVPLVAAMLTFLSHIAKGFTSAYMNPSLSYGLTFHCPGFTFWEYAVVYWLGSLTGMVLSVLLYTGRVPKIFSKKFFQKLRGRVTKGENGETKRKK